MRITRDEFRHAIEASDGTYDDMARLLGIDPGTLRTYRRQRPYVQAWCDRKREQMNRPAGMGLQAADVRGAIARHGGNVTQAAFDLGRTVRAVYYFLENHPPDARWLQETYRCT